MGVRILRILRLLRFLHELLLLLKGIVGAMKALVWSMILLLMALYITAIFMTKLIGHKLKHHEKAQLYFGSMFKSMFTLFQIATLEGWNEVARDMMAEDAVGFWVSIVFVVFLMFTNLTLLNLVTGVILENLLTIDHDDAIELVEKKRLDRLSSLRKAFDEADVNHDGVLTLEELKKTLQDPGSSVKRELARLDMGAWDAEELFVLLDYDQSGTLSADEFTRVCMEAFGPATAKQVLELQFRWYSMWSNIYTQSESTLQAIGQSNEQLSSLESVMECHQEALMARQKRLGAICETWLSQLRH